MAEVKKIGFIETTEDLSGSVEELRAITIDTINWKTGQNIQKESGCVVSLSATNSKAIALLVKLINNINHDDSILTIKEKSAYDKMILLANGGYADSTLLNDSIDAVIRNIEIAQTLISEATKATTKDKLISILKKL